MLKSIIIGFLLMLAICQDTTLGVAEQKDPQLSAKITTASQVHDRLPQTTSKTEINRRIIFIKAGDIFKGIVALAEPRHNPAELTLLIRNAISKGIPESEFEIEIEATAIMEIDTVQTTYGLHGIYAPGCQQMNLYEIQDLQAASVSESKGMLINNVIFEPVGLAGKLTDDGLTIDCEIAYNGNAHLVRLDKPFRFDETIIAISRK